MRHRALTQAYRLAGSTPMGAELMSFLRRPNVLKVLRKAAERGTQPVAAISTELMAHFPTVIHDPTVKRRIGFFVAAVLDGEGFSVERANVKMKNPLFKSAAVFRKRPEPKSQGPSVERLAQIALASPVAFEFIDQFAVRSAEVRAHVGAAASFRVGFTFLGRGIVLRSE